jgi:glycogenin glucosyltransferase
LHSQTLYDYVLPIERLATPNPKNLHLMNRADLLFTFTKINLWRQTQFRKIVYIDADVVALRAPDELFEIQDTFAAAPDVGWPDAFNSGVMVLSPNMGDYWALKTLAGAGDSFDGADQGLLNQYYEHKPWKRLSFTYNCTPSANYQYEPAYRYYKHKISMVHFIGADKPWKGSRNSGAPPSAHQELSARWWAVYDKHFKVSTAEYTVTGRRAPVRAVQAQVKSESHEASDVYYATGYPVEIARGAPPPPEAVVNTTELPFTEPGEPAENISQGIVEPPPTVEVRKFSAPHMEWDATRTAPPAESKPEAFNFPTEIYQFSTDTQPFQAPRSYPEPPKDMWFEVPKDKPRSHEKPPPIFPWEEREVPPPSRTFAEDTPPSPPPQPESPPFAMGDEFEVTVDESTRPVTPTIKIQEEPWAKFGTVNRNAWDEVEGIDQYVRAFSSWQKTRSQSQDLTQQQQQQRQQHVMSPTNEPDPIELVDRVRKRRESLLLTDFPSAIERPSLPVTPAPRRRSTFWGEEREEGMPAAEGVPDQADWDPDAQLESLRRHSLIGPSDLHLPNQKHIPERQMPSSAAPVDPEATGHPVALTRSPKDSPAPAVEAESRSSSSAKGVSFGGVSFASEESTTTATEESTTVTTSTITDEKTETSAGGLFTVPDFAQDGKNGEAEEVLSPSEEVLSPGEPGTSAAASIESALAK